MPGQHSGSVSLLRSEIPELQHAGAHTRTHTGSVWARSYTRHTPTHACLHVHLGACAHTHGHTHASA